MARSAVGVVFCNIQDKNIPELSALRAIASVPFAGRYRLIDFALSNLVNAGITTVGIVTKNNYQSLIDHIGSGKDWDLARKDGGIILLPPYSNETDAPYTNRLEALKGVMSFLRHRNEDYVVLYDGDGVARLDITDVVRFHEQAGADITMVYQETMGTPSHYYMTLETGADNRVSAVSINPVLGQKKVNQYMNVMVMQREYLMNIIQNAAQSGLSSFGRDILSKNVDYIKIYGYKFDGYYAGMASLSAYFKANMDMLDKNIRDELFGARDIYTKVRDSAPSKYMNGCAVKNSLISDGCYIEGTVENSILFRGVKVGKGSVVKNSVLMQDTVVGSSVRLDCVITDKNVVIRDRRNLAGCEELPYYIAKGKML